MIKYFSCSPCANQGDNIIVFNRRCTFTNITPSQAGIRQQPGFCVVVGSTDKWFHKRHFLRLLRRNLSLEDHCGCSGNGGAIIIFTMHGILHWQEHASVPRTATEHRGGLHHLEGFESAIICHGVGCC